MHYTNDNTATDLYLVRIWRGSPRGDGSLNVRGKLQHVISGESSFFKTLSDLPEALEKMMGNENSSFGPEETGPVNDES